MSNYSGYNKTSNKGIIEADQVELLVPIYESYHALATGAAWAKDSHIGTLECALDIVALAAKKAKVETASFLRIVDDARSAIFGVDARSKNGGFKQFFIDEKSAVLRFIRLLENYLAEADYKEAQAIVDEAIANVTGVSLPKDEKQDDYESLDGKSKAKVLILSVVESRTKGIEERDLLEHASKLIISFGLKFNKAECQNGIAEMLKSGLLRTEVSRVGVSKPKLKYFYAGSKKND